MSLHTQQQQHKIQAILHQRSTIRTQILALIAPSPIEYFLTVNSAQFVSPRAYSRSRSRIIMKSFVRICNYIYYYFIQLYCMLIAVCACTRRVRRGTRCTTQINAPRTRNAVTSRVRGAHTHTHTHT